MKYASDDMEMRSVLDTASRMCAAARTAPKAKGIDKIITLVLTEADKDALADEMERLSGVFGAEFLERDAGNVRTAQAIVLIGTKNSRRGLGDMCGYCGFKNCAECAQAGGVCAYDPMDLGIAIGSAVSVAADARVDNRVLFSAGRAAKELRLMGEDVGAVCGIPLSVKGKSPFFDRKKKTEAVK